jgi:hypothetical protein
MKAEQIDHFSVGHAIITKEMCCARMVDVTKLYKYPDGNSV